MIKYVYEQSQITLSHRRQIGHQAFQSRARRLANDWKRRFLGEATQVVEKLYRKKNGDNGRSFALSRIVIVDDFLRASWPRLFCRLAQSFRNAQIIGAAHSLAVSEGLCCNRPATQASLARIGIPLTGNFNKENN